MRCVPSNERPGIVKISAPNQRAAQQVLYRPLSSLATACAPRGRRG
jgi:hypothetical protein